MTTIGYGRVSLDEQNPDLQINALRAAKHRRLRAWSLGGAHASLPASRTRPRGRQVQRKRAQRHTE